jgi:hypothetical protein
MDYKFYIFYGITQDPETKNYMLVLNNKCKKCHNICNAIYFQQQFIDWSSGNNDIDKSIQDSQLLAHKDVSNVLEWIPYDRFYDIKYIAKGKYEASWIDGNIICWNSSKNQNWKRHGDEDVILKSLNNTNNPILEFMSEV